MKKLKKPKDAKSITKFHDTNSTAKERLSGFLQVNYKGKSDEVQKYNEATQHFITENYSVMIHLIYEAFWSYQEHVFTKKNNKKHTAEETDVIEVIIPTLEKVLQYLPEKIHELWHYNGIGSILKTILTKYEVLAPTNSFELRCKGIKLTILWILGLLDVNGVAETVFTCILPKDDQADYLFRNDSNDITQLFKHLLDNLTCNVFHIYWVDKKPEEQRDLQIKGFKTVFNLFKKVYFHEIYYNPKRSIPPSDSHHSRSSSNRRTYSASSRRSDTDTPPFSHHGARGSRVRPDDEYESRKCRKCDSEAHDTEKCPYCVKCKDRRKHKATDCTLTVVDEITMRFMKEMNCTFFSKLIIEIKHEMMKWFITQAKNVYPHTLTQCPFMTVVKKEAGGHDIPEPKHNYEDQVGTCEVVDRVLFTDREYTSLMHEAFEMGPLVLQHYDDTNVGRGHEDDEYDLITKVILIYYELILTIKQYNLASDFRCPEFLSDRKLKRKNNRRSAVDNEQRCHDRVKSFIKDVTLNVAPILRYPQNFLSFNPETKKRVEKAAHLTTSLYLAILQKIKQADATVSFRIIMCIITAIEYNHKAGIPFNYYKNHLSHLLDAVKFVGRKVVLPERTWESVQGILYKLGNSTVLKLGKNIPIQDKSEFYRANFDKANEIWTNSMVDITREISVCVYNLGLSSRQQRDDKTTKSKKKLASSCHTEEKGHLFNKLLKFPQFRNLQKKRHKTSVLDKGGLDDSESSNYHYHGRNAICETIVNERNMNLDKEEEIEEDDNLRDDNGEHPIILWRRFLTLQGNPNKYKDNSRQHFKIFESLNNILEILLRVDLCKDSTLEPNTSAQHDCLVYVPDHPVSTYIYHILPWLFEAHLLDTTGNYQLQDGKREAMRMLCKCLIRLNPIKPQFEVLHIFYNVLFNALNTNIINKNAVNKLTPDQEVMCEVVRGCKDIFSLNIEGCAVIRDSLMKSAGNVLSLPDEVLKDRKDPKDLTERRERVVVPKAEAIMLLGSLFSVPWSTKDMKKYIIGKMKGVASTNENQYHRSRAVGMLGYMILTLLSENKYTEQAPISPQSQDVDQILKGLEIESNLNRQMSTSSFDSKQLKEMAKEESKNMVDLVNIVLFQIQSNNILVALSSLAVIRDLTEVIDKLLNCDSNLHITVLKHLLVALDKHMECVRTSANDDLELQSQKVYPLMMDPITGSHTPQFKPPSPKLSVIKPDAVIANTIWTIVEWMLNMPSDVQNHDYTVLLQDVFKVLQLVALNQPFVDEVRHYRREIEEIRKRKYNNIGLMKESPQDSDTMGQIDCSLPKLPGSENSHDIIASCAETALFLVCQRYHHFPLCGGPDYSSSMVYEYKSRNLDKQHLEELKLFDPNKDLQMIVMDDRIVVSLIEFDSRADNAFQLPFESQPGFGRVIFRNVAGRFSWMSKRLYGLKGPPNSPAPMLELVDQTAEDECDSDNQYSTLTPGQTAPGDYRELTGPPTYENRDKNDTRDLLHQQYDYIGQTSEELPFYRKKRQDRDELGAEEENFSKIRSMLENQVTNEENSDKHSDTPNNMTMRSDTSYNAMNVGAPFQQCRGIVSNLGLLNWAKREESGGQRIELLKFKNGQIDPDGDKPILMDFDQAYTREILKFGLVYIAKGQEKREDIFRNDVGSQEFEEFVAGLGWEVKWQDLQGYTPTISRGCEMGSTIHYATSTCEVLFHVSTRLTPGNQDPIVYKFKYIGNDYVVIVWSEHDREVNTDVFKSNYLDIIIVIYPMKDLQKYRIQIIEKENTRMEPFIGPLFDGALVSKDVLPYLVRKTCINASRFIAVTQNRPNFYTERAELRDKLMKHKKECTFEELATEIMSPSLFDFAAEFNDYQKRVDKFSLQRSNSKVTKRSHHNRQSAGHLSQDNMSESERKSESERNSKKFPFRQQSDSDRDTAKARYR